MNAYQWYGILSQTARAHIQGQVQRLKPDNLPIIQNSNRTPHKKNENTTQTAIPTRPSDYLRRQCPLCFGGARPDLESSPCVLALFLFHALTKALDRMWWFL